MADETSTCMSNNAVGQGAGANGASLLDLRQENLRLRAELQQCDVIAARHVVMLREGDHRIKNSLQLVGSLMRLQARRETSMSAQTALWAAASRVGSVASIHDALQGTRGAGAIDLGAALRRMCMSLQTMGGDEGHIQVVVDAGPLEVAVSLAQPLALAVNELVMNALRHAFGDRGRGTVTVTLLRTDEGLAVSVSDDGLGLPHNYATAHGYGMGLVAMMVTQIGGVLTAESVNGARFTISSPLPRDA